MTYIFQVDTGIDLPTAEEAIAIAEQKNTAHVVKFRVEPNQPYYLPKFVHKRCNMWSFERNRTPQWCVHSIYDGLGAPLKEEKPN